MSSKALSEEDIKLLEKVARDNIEYIRLEMCDIYCRSIGKLIPARDLKEYLLNGFLICKAQYGSTAEFLHCFMDFDVIDLGNIQCSLYHDTYCTLPSILCDNANIARIMYYPYDYKIFNVDSRALCLQQLSILNEEFGYNLYSSFEHEFQMFDITKITKLTPLWNYRRLNCNITLTKYESFVFDCERALKSIGINLECMHTEYGLGRYEWTMKPSFNIKSADNSFLYKQIIKQIAMKQPKYGYLASFCTTPLCDESIVNNGAHFNHSLWNNKLTDNIFYDDNTNDGLSIIAKYWIGGILKHTKGMTAFNVPTYNCYRRSNGSFYSTISWGFDNRKVIVRIKNEGKLKKQTYIEYRLPSSAVNPYLVIASLLIAGMDGIRNKILPNMKPLSKTNHDVSKFEKVPQNLECALDELLKDKVICDGFGNDFITLYVGIKKKEIESVKKLTKEMGNTNKAEQFLFSKL